jgi:hypothetical protein
LSNSEATDPVTDREQAKVALAALADRECKRGERPPNRRTVSEADREQGGAERSENPPDWRTVSEANREPGETREPAADEMLTPESGPTVIREADGDAEYRLVIERAVAATEDIDAAAAFVESVGLDRLEAAVETAEREVSGLVAEGREALVTFERFRVAAEGPVDG